MVPTHIFLTRGVGVHREKLASFEEALRSAGVAYCNLVSVSSILPPNCKNYPAEAGRKPVESRRDHLLRHGQE